MLQTNTWTDVMQCNAMLCLPEEGRSFAWQPLQVVPPGRGWQGLHICPVGRANDVKQGMQLRLSGAVDGSHLPICLPTGHMVSWTVTPPGLAVQHHNDLAAVHSRNICTVACCLQSESAALSMLGLKAAGPMQVKVFQHVELHCRAL